MRERMTSSGTARLTTRLRPVSVFSPSRSSRRLAWEAFRGKPSKIQFYLKVSDSVLNNAGVANAR
jgi:hypothetical protein